ncbi:hypothetical protein [Massilia sp. TWR1-2-2]|uniref:hypothetical protein n=1 Tax=Massilia sp. TWR1-2-2 TaxID=2804584 RepID=UPI003CEA4F6D
MSKKRKDVIVGAFLAVPLAVLNSPKYRALSGSAVKLLFDIASQYNGKNNGDLSAAWKIMKPKGWRSEGTLDRAKKELLAAEFIDETRKGQFPNTCSLYGLTFKALNPNPKLDVGPNGFAAGAWANLPRETKQKIAIATTKTVVEEPSTATDMAVEEFA